MTLEESYKVLKLKSDAKEEDVRIAYKKMIKKYHPDTYKGDKNVANQKMMKINQAYRILTFKEKPEPSLNVKKKKKSVFSFFGFFKRLKKNKAKKQKAKEEKIEQDKLAKERKKQEKKEKREKIANLIVAPEMILFGIMAIILIFLIIWFLAAGK